MDMNETTDLIKSVTDMTATVAGKIGEIDQRVDTAEEEFDQFITQSRLESPIFRQSKNQNCSLTGSSMDFFTKNSQYTLNVSLYRTIVTGTLWVDRDPEEKEIMTAMGMSGQRYFSPSIRVMKMVWSGYQVENHSSYSMFPTPIANGSGYVTVASYAKLVSGSIDGWWLTDVDSSWGLCGVHLPGTTGRYIHAHPYVDSASGEVLFIWPGVVSGHVPLDRNSPKWSYWPSIYSESPYAN
ncbi:hypothetical protein [Marinomonas transparens]|uniref:Uncharacterized protein n=1 Tax=Marinomonas transparens TaxID=2795388 RepID=A0A934MV52_9GAMM|nr:hypothetical protein [Marinomonas transparens]MBJ7536634.1 hypothetical protein [Marinomonas transparens]